MSDDVRIKKLEKRVSTARRVMVMSQPFYGVLSLRLNLKFCEILPNGETLPTAATDGDSLYFNPDFVEAVPIF